MHILIITPQVPFPPRQGTSIRNYNLVTRLAERHTVDLLTFLAPGDELMPDSPLQRACRRIVAVPQPARSTLTRLRDLVTSPLPDMALRLESPAMHELAQTWLHEDHYDALQLEGIEVAQYARHANRQHSTVVFDNHNCEYLLQQRNALTDLANPRRWHAAAYSLVQWAKLRRYEAQVCTSADTTFAVSEPDRKALLKIAPNADIRLAANGIDPDVYLPSNAPASKSSGESARLTLLFTGKMDYRPNIDAVIWFADNVLPNLVAAAPEVHFHVVGMNPHPRLDRLRQHPNIEITGSVPDTLPYIHAADVYVIPMRVGGGTRFKALEAMAAGKAIVSTRLGVEGIDVVNEREMLLADAPDEFAVAILRLLADQRAGGTLTQRLGEAGQRFASENYAWERIMPAFERLYNERPARRMADRLQPPIA